MSLLLTGSALGQSVDLAITGISDLPTDITLGQGNVTYTINTYNYSSTAATNAILTITLPASSSYVSSSSANYTCTPGAGVVTCTLATFNAFNSPSATVTVTPGVGGLNTISASITATQPDPVTSNNTGSEATTVNATIDLAVTGISDVPTDITLGQGTVTYTISTYNYSSSKATNAVLTINLPASSTYVSSSSSTYTCTHSAGVVTCTLATFNAGNSPSATVVVTPGAGGTNTLTASIAADQGDPNMANNSQSEPTTVNATLDLAVTGISDVPTDITLGQGNVTYTINTYNYSTSKATNAVLTINLPASSTYVSSSGTYACTESAGVVICTLATFNAGNSPSATVVVTPGVGGTNTLTASIAADQGDPNTANNSDSEPTTVNATIDLAVTNINDVPADITLGQGNVTYTISTYNYSTSKATNAVLTINLPASSTYVSSSGSYACTESAGVVTCTLATFNAANGPSATVVVTPGVGGTNTLTASIAADQGDPNTANNSDSEPTTVNATIDLAVTNINDVPADVTLGQGNVTYTISTYNYSTSKATNAVLTINLPASSTYVSSSGSYACTESAGVVTCTLATFNAANGPSATVVVTPGVGGTNTLSATIAADQGDPNTANNSDSEPTTVNATIDLQLTISDTPDPRVLAAGNVTYNVSIFNATSSKATNPLLTFSLPATVTFVSATASTPGSCTQAGGVVTCTWIDIAASSSRSAAIVVTPTVAGQLSATGTISADQGDPNTANNSETETTNINPGSAPVITTFTPSSGPVDTVVTISGANFFSSTLVRFNGVSSSFTVNTDGSITATVPAGATTGPIAITNSVGTTTSTATFTVTPKPDLTISKTASGATVPTSSSLTYTIAVTNAGPGPAANVTVTDTLPAGVTLVSNGTDTNWNCSGNPVITCSFNPGTLAVGAAPSITITVTSPATGTTITNTASVSTTTPEVSTANNTSSVSVGVVGCPGTPAITAPASVCASSTGHTASTPAVPGATYAWTIVNGSIVGSTTGNAVTFDASTTDPITLTVSVFVASCPTATNSVTVSVSTPAATITPSGPTTFCDGNSVTLTANNGAAWLWSTGATTQSITVSTSEVVTVTVTNAAGCAATSAPTTVSVNPLPATPTVTAGGPTTFCAGGSVTLTSSSATGFQWKLDGTIITGATGPTFVATVTGNYTVVVTGGNGCPAESAAVAVQSNFPPAAPTVTASGPTTFCTGGSVTLTSSTSSGNQWKLDGSILPGGTGQSIIATTAGSYTVVFTDGSGCSAESTPVIVQVDPPPATPTITATGPTTFCAGGSVTLTSSSAAGNQWKKDGVVLTGQTAQTFSATASGGYTVVFTDVSGCSAESLPTVVSVQPAPAAPVITASGPTSFCAGGSVTLTSSSTSGKQWMLNGSPISGEIGDTYLATASGTYSVIVTDGGGCSSESAPTVVQVFPTPPPPTITASGPTSFCTGGSVTLTASAGASYLWSNGATTQSTTVSAAGSYSVTVTDGNGCAATSSPTAVSVTASPIATVTASGPTTFCAGGSVVLTASSGASWLWSNGATTQSITVAGSGDYLVSVTESNGCTATSSPVAVIVTPVPPTPVITASGPTTFCAGSSVTLSSPAAASYLWSNGATTQSITVSASGSYNVTVTNASGCSASSAPVSVTVNPPPPAPTITASGSTTFCQGGSVTLTASAGSSWLWSNGATTQSITVSAAGSYSVTVTDGNGCAATSSPTTVSVSASPTATVTASGPTTFCPGGSVVLTASSGASWLWSNGATTQSITVTGSGNYSVTVTGSNGCTATSSPVAVVVNAVPSTPVITASGPTSFCAGGSVTLTAPTSTSYLWSNGATTQSITVTASGSYDVTVTNASGCSASSAPVSVTVNPLPPAPTITASGSTTFCQGGSVILTSSAGSSWLWSNGAATQSITVFSGGNYSVTVADGNGCPSTSAPTPVTVTSPPIVRISGPSSLCGAGTATLTIEGSGVSGVTWSTGATSMSINVSPTSTTTYSAVVVSGSCTTTVSHTITVTNAGPPLSINAPASVPALSTGNVASVPGGASEGYSWSIFNGTITAGQGTPSITFTAGASGAISLNVTMDSSGCPSNGTTTIAIESCATIAPALISPAPGIASAQSPVTFVWSAVAGAIDYEVWRVVAGSTPALIGTTSSTSLTADVPSGGYAWYVTARLQQSCNPQRLSSAEVRAITVVPSTNCPTLAPALVSPASGSTPFSPVVFDWTGVPDAIAYRVMVSLGGLPAIELDSTDSDTTELIAEVPVGAVSWWVEAIYPGCPPVASAIGEFRVELEDCSKHERARLISPSDNAVADSSAVTFSWGAVDGADGYAVWAVLDDGPSKIGETLGATSLTAVVPSGRREWYVETLFEGCPSTESDHRFLVVPASANCSAAAPELAGPGAGATVSSPLVTFSWSSVSGAVLYELWLSVGGGAEALIGRTTSTSITSEVPSGAITWFVRARLNGCPHVDSSRRELRYEPPTGCSTMVPMPLLPMDDGRPITSPVAFRWTAVPGATQYKIYLGRGANGVFELKATTSVPVADGIAVSNGESRWFVEAIFNGCPSTRSSQSRFVAVPVPASCIDLAAPVISLPGQISAGTPYTVQWSAVPGAESYLLTEFIGSSARTMTITGQSAHFDYDNPSSEGHMYVYRVRGVDEDCNPAREGALSTELGISILPRRSPESSALVGSQPTVQHTIAIGADRAGQTFVASAVQPWITITPSTGVVPPGGIDLVATADVTGLPLGTSIGSVTITFGGGGGSRQVTTDTGPVTKPISISLVTPVTPTPKSTPPPDALIIPAVAHADGINAQFRSDVRVSNTSPQIMKYQLTFVPSGETGITQGRQTTLDIEPGRTIALDDVLRSWFGTGDSSILGTLEIRPVTQSSSATSSAATRGVPNFVTFASSRTFNQTPNGTFGTYIAAIPFANFIGHSTDSSKSVLSMQQIAQSSVYRSNLGFVEGSGNPAELLVSVFAPSGAKITDFPVSLTGGQHLQMNSFLATRGIQLDDGRLEVKVTSGTGRVTSYASVVNNATGDSLVVSPMTLGDTTSSKYVLPGVAELSGGVVWQTDMRLFNAGAQPVTATLTLQSLNGSPQQQATVQLAAGEVKQLDRVLATLFGVANDGGALHITTESASKLIATARTFRPAGDGANFGQFIQAVTPDQAIALGSRPLQLLQVEESPRFRSNVGIAEVSGRPARVELTVIPPDAKVSARIEVDLAANQFRQLNSLLSAMGLQGTHNARVTVKVIGGQGRVTAYAATIDALTQDPTFIPAQ